MGISVSNSDANQQVQKVREYKKQKRLEMIGSQVNRATYDRFNAAALKQNYRQSKSASLSPARANTRNGTLNQQNANNITSEGQKKAQNNTSQGAQQHSQYISKDAKGPDNRKNMHRQRFAEIQQNVNKIDQTLIKQVQPVDVKRSYNNKSWRGPLPKQSTPAQRPTQQKEFDIQMRRLSFGQFDWNIPGEQEQKEFYKRKALMPSMNLILSNKFAQNTNNINEQEQKSNAKSRRQVMRQLLSGKRNTAEQDFKLIPNCNFQRVQVSRMCRNR